MEANELRIGNYVNIDSPEKTQKSILKIENGVQIDNLIHVLHSPIPLTDGLLLKAGFEYDEYQYLYELNTVIIHIQNGILTFRKHYLLNKEFEYEEIEIKYLHQLQNLYFALTGKEIEIKL